MPVSSFVTTFVKQYLLFESSRVKNPIMTHRHTLELLDLLFGAITRSERSNFAFVYRS